MSPAIIAAIISAGTAIVVLLIQLLFKSREKAQPKAEPNFIVPPLPTNYIERPAALDAIRKLLLGNAQGKRIAVTGLRGMGGIGKTVLAQALCRDKLVLRAFRDGVCWITIGEHPSADELASHIRELLATLGGLTEGADTLGVCSARLAQVLRKRSILLVLDDVWKIRDIQPFLTGAPKCRLLFTTRKAQIVAALGAEEYSVDILSRKEAMKLLQDYSRRSWEKGGFPEDAVKVAYECGRLALALAVIGSLMRDKPDDHWAIILEKLRAYKLEELEQQFPNYGYPNVLKALQVSVDELDETSRSQYIKLAVLPEDVAIPEAALEVLWNVDKHRVQDAFDRLVDLSLARRDARGRLLLHDLQLSFLRRAAGECLPEKHRDFLETYRFKCGGNWTDGPNDGYFFERLAHHMLRGGMQEELRCVLLDFNWLNAKVRVSPFALVSDYSNFGGDPDLRLIEDAIRLSLSYVVTEPALLAGQLTARLLGVHSTTIKNFLKRIESQAPRPWLRPLAATLVPAGGPLRAILAAHTGSVRRVALTADGRRAVSAYEDGNLKIWELDSGRELRTLSFPEQISSLAFSADGRRAVFASKHKTAKVWDLDTGQELRPLKSKMQIMCAEVTADGRRAISVSGDYTLQVWNVDDAKEIYSIKAAHQPYRIFNVYEPNRIYGVVLSADGRRAASISEGRELKIWNLDDGHELLTLGGLIGRLHSLAISADGRRAVSAYGEDSVTVWDLDGGNELRRLKGTAQIVYAHITADGRRAVSVSADNFLTIWDIETGQMLRRITVWTELCWAISSDACRAVSASSDGLIKVWNLDTDQNLRPVAYRTTTLAVSSNCNRAVSATHSNFLKLWDLESAHELRTLGGHTTLITSLAISADGRRAVSVSVCGAIKLWDLIRGCELRTIETYIRLNSVALTADGSRALTGSSDITLKLWDLDKGSELRTLTGFSAITCLATDSDGQRAISASNGTILLWDLERSGGPRSLGWMPTSDFTVTKDWANVVAISSDGRRALWVSESRALKVWDLDKDCELRTIKGHADRVNSVAINADGHRGVSVSDDRTLKVWDLDTGDAIAFFRAEADMRICGITGDGINIVGGDDAGVIHFLILEDSHTTANSGGA